MSASRRRLARSGQPCALDTLGSVRAFPGRVRAKPVTGKPISKFLSNIQTSGVDAATGPRSIAGTSPCRKAIWEAIHE
jgi:hypothetical protein